MSGLKPSLPAELPVARRRPQFGVPAAFWVITVAVGVCAGTALALLHVARPSSSGLAASASAAAPAVIWAAGQRRAPDFRLRDQNGHAVSLSLYRGRPVIVTFIDPLCRNLCPVEAGVLESVERSLPPSLRPAIVAVSVDPWGDARSNLREDDQKWHLGAPWRWAVGSSAELRSVWRHYEIGVTVAKKTYAGVSEREIAHTEAAFLIDPAGYQRALYLFPFQAPDLARTVRQLAGVARG